MSAERESGERYGGLDLEKSTRLLRLGLGGSGRPVDELALRLEAADGHRWFGELLERDAVLRQLSAQIVSGNVDLGELNSLKEAAKTKLAAANDQDARLEGVAAYFLSLAAALVHCGTLISSHSAPDLAAVFVDLAAVTPSPWDEQLTRAASACRDRSAE